MCVCVCVCVTVRRYRNFPSYPEGRTEMLPTQDARTGAVYTVQSVYTCF